jgi:hypothetical protein
MSTTQARRSRTTLVALTTIVIVAIGAAAFAYWTSDGSGDGTGTTGSVTDFTITSSAPTGPDLKPGVGEQSVAFVVTNPSDGSQMLSDVTVTVANADGTAWTSVAGCSAADYAIGDVDITYSDMAAGATAEGTVTLTMNNTATDQEGCKDADVPLYFLAS